MHLTSLTSISFTILWNVSSDMEDDTDVYIFVLTSSPSIYNESSCFASNNTSDTIMIQLVDIVVYLCVTPLWSIWKSHRWYIQRCCRWINRWYSGVVGMSHCIISWWIWLLVMVCREYLLSSLLLLALLTLLLALLALLPTWLICCCFILYFHQNWNAYSSCHHPLHLSLN